MFFPGALQAVSARLDELAPPESKTHLTEIKHHAGNDEPEAKPSPEKQDMQEMLPADTMSALSAPCTSMGSLRCTYATSIKLEPTSGAPEPASAAAAQLTKAACSAAAKAAQYDKGESNDCLGKLDERTADEQAHWSQKLHVKQDASLPW